MIATVMTYGRSSARAMMNAEMSTDQIATSTYKTSGIVVSVSGAPSESADADSRAEPAEG